MNNNKIVSTKTTNAIFLAIVLVTGTITALSSIPSFMIDTQAQPYYGIDKKYNSYEPLYGMDSYDKPIPIYDDKKLYDDKPIYPSYVKDDKRDKSKKDSSLILKKNKCNNNNVNVNGDNTADFNIGNKGLPTTAYAEGDLSPNAVGGGYGERNNNGFKNNGKFDPDCSINNNNNNIQPAGTGTGQVGPQGPEGPQGPPGPNHILPANLYYNPGDVVSITGTVPGTPGNSTATCQAGDIAIGGSFDVISYTVTLLGDPTANVAILYDGNEGFDKYSTDVMLFGNGNQLIFTTNVLCFNNP